MKKIILATMMVFSNAAFAKSVVVKECSVTMKHLETGKPVDMNMKVIDKSDGTLTTVVTTTSEGVTGSYDTVAAISEDSVRPNLTSQSDTDQLNEAELLVVHAMALSEDPVFGGEYSPGIDLKNVRSAKMYTIGERTNMGSTTIVEAKDANNQVLGSYLGGFLVAPCK